MFSAIFLYAQQKLVNNKFA